jgi:hypothetical protein
VTRTESAAAGDQVQATCFRCRQRVFTFASHENSSSNHCPWMETDEGSKQEGKESGPMAAAHTASILDIPGVELTDFISLCRDAYSRCTL